MGELCLKVDFGHGPLQFREEEERIVAETTGAAWCVEDYAFDRAVGGVFDAAVSGGDQHTVVSRLALFGWHVTDALKEDYVIPDIGIVVGIRGIDHTCVGCETS